MEQPLWRTVWQLLKNNQTCSYHRAQQWPSWASVQRARIPFTQTLGTTFVAASFLKARKWQHPHVLPWRGEWRNTGPSVRGLLLCNGKGQVMGTCHSLGDCPENDADGKS